MNIPPPPPRPQSIPPYPGRTAIQYEQDTGVYSLPMWGGTTPSWCRVLKNVGYPTEVLTLDWETYFDSEYGLKDLSHVEYIADPRFEILGLAFKLGNRPAGWVTGSDVDKFLASAPLNVTTVAMHNAAFDAMILAKRFNIFPPFLIDTIGLARAWNSLEKHGLAEQCKKYKLLAKGDTSQFSGVTRRRRWVKGKRNKAPTQRPLITPEQETALATYATNDVDRQWELLTILLPRLSNPGVELKLMQHTLELATKPTLMIDFKLGEKLKAEFQGELDKTIAATGCTYEEISGNNSYEGLLCEALKDAGDSPFNYMKVCKKGWKVADAKGDGERALLLNHPNEKVRSLSESRAMIKSLPNHISRVEALMDQARAFGGKFPVPLKYCGAHTGRWSGDEGLNVQNFGKGDLIGQIRGMLIPPPDHFMVIVDASAIEARVLAWVAGQNDLVEKFAKGADVYCDFASSVLGRRIRKPRKDDPEPIANYMKWARNSIGKVGVLGCGYGMGAEKIMDYAGGAIDFETAERIKTVYRRDNAKIVNYWYDVEKAFAYTARYKTSCQLGQVRFDSLPDCDVCVTLPSGRELHYPQVKCADNVLEVCNNIRHKWDYLWGGTLVENIVQAISRDLLGESLLRCEARGITVCFHCHDELVSVMPYRTLDASDEDKKWVLNTMIEEMSRVPSWGSGMPLAAEGQIVERYCK